MLRSVLRFLCRLAVACCLWPLALRAQAPAGAVTGRVYHAGTKEYVRNAEIRVEGGAAVAYSEDGGFFRLAGVPAGEVTLTVNYAGAQPATVKLVVAPGGTATRDVELQPAGHAPGARGDGVLKMGEFTVSAEREGQAKAIMDQRAALNAKSIVAADNFGDLTMGDVGEFLKYMPGLALDYLEVDTHAVRIGGLDPKYATFTQDGMRMASSEPGFGAASRQSTFEQMSITGADVVEFNNTLTASMDADSAAGAINLRSKNAFDRNGRRIAFQAYLMGTSDAVTLAREYLPDDRRHFKVFPAGQLGYADVFLGRRLGVEFNTSYNASFVEQDRNQVEYNYTDPGRPAITGIMWRPGPKMTSRFAANLSADFKVSPGLVFSWRSTYSLYEVEFFNQYTWLRASLPQITADSTLTRVTAAATANANTRLGTEYSHRHNYQPNYVLAPKLEYKKDALVVTLRGGYSSSKTSNRDMADGFFRNTNNRITRMSWQAERPSADSAQWTVRQLSGPDWAVASNWGSRDPHANNIVSNADETRAQMFSGNLDVKRSLRLLGQPVELKTGVAARLNTYSYTAGNQQWTYVGATGSQLQAVVPATQHYAFDIDLGGEGGNINALHWRADDTYEMYRVYQAHPEWFTPDTLGNYMRGLTGARGMKEEIDSAYLEGNARVDRLRLNAGLRAERTRTKGLTWDPRSRAEIVAAGFPVNSAGAPTTAAGVLYQYRNGERTAHYGDYSNLFLSGGGKYFFTRNLVGQLALSESILRPDYGNLAGITSINEAAASITVPNPNLRPEMSTKYFAGLQYYFEPAGTLSVSAYRLNVKHQLSTRRQITAAQAGYDPADYPGYTFLGFRNGDQARRTDGFTVDYDQKLTFLPAAFRGLSVFGSVTRAIADQPEIGLTPKSANGGFRFHRGRVSLQVRSTWQAARLISVSAPLNGSLWLAERTLVDVSGGYRLSDRFELMFSVRNVCNAPSRQYSNEPGRTQMYDVYGALWNFGLKGTF